MEDTPLTNDVELTVASFTDEGPPPPYQRKGCQPNPHTPHTLSIDMSGNTLIPPNGHLTSPESSRRRHKSDGALPVATLTCQASDNHHLSPSQRKCSVFGSRSTISGIKFDDPYVEDGKSSDRTSWKSADSDDDESGLTLMYSKHEKLPMKDFSMEVRASMDVQNFLKKTVLILDLNKVSLDEIIDEILHKLLDSSGSKHSFDQARSALFTHDCVHQLSRTLQCTSISEGGGFDYDQNWICALASIPSIQSRHVGIARLHHPANLGTSSQEVHFVIVVLTPTKEKGTKNELETGRTFSTIMSDPELRMKLLEANTEPEFKKILEFHTNTLAERQKNWTSEKAVFSAEHHDRTSFRCSLFHGIQEDLKRRFPVYLSDYRDGVVGSKSIQKTISTTFFLYFACLMPSIAFGVLNANNTKGQLNVEKVLYSQIFGGLLFAFCGGTPHIILLTTAPLALYTKIIYSISQDFDINFQAFYACVGLWNSFFLFLYSAFDLSVLMKWSTRSSEEIFALFISIAFCVDAFKDAASNFGVHYYIPGCTQTAANISTVNHSVISAASNLTVSMTRNTTAPPGGCERDLSLLYLLLLLGTLWLGVTLYNFTMTPYLNAGKRELLADYSLPVAVIIMSFFGSYVFRDVQLDSSFTPTELSLEVFKLVPIHKLPVGAVFGAMGLGFCLSLLFFMDQNISAALVNAPQNKLKKGTSYHWDLLVCGVINATLSLMAFPWVHAALPHSPLHVRALADVEERVDQGHIYQIIVRVRETRLTAIFSHILIGLSLFILNFLSYIPTPVLYGLFLYVGVTALYGNQLFERIMLLITEQSAYPPNHYIRRVPQRKIHLFTVLQLLQLLVLCAFGFTPYPYLKMFFPVLIFLLIPLRQKVIPHLIQQKFLKAIDGH
ncbi:solute carrier family 4 member 11-like [Ostrea edulis]|uniref:solute carrier family 4 member 11-like n=1 Tax=Ostrea edulis TaxID=37623 RepID=UPI002094C9BE|nr:solute carrier family 4 member 11-like [Ostrea edulis]XP_048774702.1 solute carrier family 4 member 11-like [Ostrea edulis]XP_048774703.1 solute carrier family 4 member 11-like [Ostrea edulis]XP_048774704.1 solute carrier family 4 member 11-like [Ostrea edulis]XP_048774705.1 solute carrier family 4 member 11-like [Ostrea edulis]